MAFVTRQVTRTSQPQGLVGVSADLGIKYAYVPSLGLQQPLQSVILGSGRFGRQHTNTATANGGVTLSKPNRPLSGTAYSIFLLARVDALGSNSTLFSIPHSSSWSPPYAPILFRRDGTGSGLSVFHGGAGGSLESLSSSAGAIAADGVWRLYEVRRNEGVVSFYVDGVSYGTAAASITSDFSGDKLPTFFGAPPLSSSEGIGGSCAVGMYSDKYIPDVLAARIRTNIWQIFEPITETVWIADSVGGGGTTLTAPLLGSTSTLYPPSLTLGPVALAAPLLSASSQLYAPSVTLGPVTLTVPVIVGASQLFAPSIAVGARTLTAPLIASAAAVYAPSLVMSGSLAAPLMASTSVLYPPQITVGPVTVAAPLIASSAQAFAPAIAVGMQALSAPNLASVSQLFAPSLNVGAVQLVVPRLPSSHAFFVHQALGGIVAERMPKAEAIFSGARYEVISGRAIGITTH